MFLFAVPLHWLPSRWLRDDVLRYLSRESHLAKGHLSVGWSCACWTFLPWIKALLLRSISWVFFFEGRLCTFYTHTQPGNVHVDVLRKRLYQLHSSQNQYTNLWFKKNFVIPTCMGLMKNENTLCFCIYIFLHIYKPISIKHTKMIFHQNMWVYLSI